MIYGRSLFSVLGIVHLLSAGFLLAIGLMAGSKPYMITWLCVSMAVMSFSMAYLYPQWVQKDERMKLIRQKGMFFSMTALMLYLIVFMILLGFKIVSLPALEVIYILTALLISTLFLSFVIYSIIY